jgi:hypothetical protein
VLANPLPSLSLRFMDAPGIPDIPFERYDDDAICHCLNEAIPRVSPCRENIDGPRPTGSTNQQYPRHRLWHRQMAARTLRCYVCPPALPRPVDIDLGKHLPVNVVAFVDDAGRDRPEAVAIGANTPPNFHHNRGR